MSKNDKINIDERMSKYKMMNFQQINSNNYLIIRLDGNMFWKFACKLKRPYDIDFIKAINLTQIDLLNKYNCQTTYSQSDEINLIFNKKSNNYNHIYNGNIMEIKLNVSNYCSLQFNYHINKIFQKYRDTNNYTDNLLNLIEKCEQTFKTQIFSMENRNEITNYLIWRSINNYEPTVIKEYAKCYCDRSKYYEIINNKNISTNKIKYELIKLLQEVDIDWHEDIPIYIKHGVYAKKTNNNNNTNVVLKTFRIKYNEKLPNLLIYSHWNNEILNIDNIHNL
jgi:hypothetical protein